ncbi:hypothetical protein MMC26_002687 [Xylographa opegraphella]|nr:hypothetical protein [Xylographa opegraphella]
MHEPGVSSRATSLVTDAYKTKTVDAITWPLEELGYFAIKANEEEAPIIQSTPIIITNGKIPFPTNIEVQSPEWAEEYWINHESHINFEHNRSSSGSLTDSDLEGFSSSLCSTESTGSDASNGTNESDGSKFLTPDSVPNSFNSFKPPRKYINGQGFDINDLLETDDTVTESVFDAGQGSTERFVRPCQPVSHMSHFVLNGLLVAMHHKFKDEDKYFNYHSDDELKVRNGDIENFYDSLIDSDPVTTTPQATKVSTYAAPQFGRSSFIGHVIISRTNDDDQAVTMKAAVEEKQIKNGSTPGITLIRSPTSQDWASLSQPSILMLPTEAPSIGTNVLGSSTEETKLSLGERRARERDTPETPGIRTTAGKAEGQGFVRCPNILTSRLEDAIVEPVPFDCGVGFSLPVPNLSDSLLYGSIAGYLGYRIFTALRR